MMHAYEKMYLADASATLGFMYDFAVNALHYPLKDFQNLFLASDFSSDFACGDSRLLAGTSGKELAYNVLSKPVDYSLNYLVFHRSEEYWVGWALAQYQWYTGMSFQEIDQKFPIEEIKEMYMPYHEMDISHFIEDLESARK